MLRVTEFDACPRPLLCDKNTQTATGFREGRPGPHEAAVLGPAGLGGRALLQECPHPVRQRCVGPTASAMRWGGFHWGQQVHWVATPHGDWKAGSCVPIGVTVGLVVHADPIKRHPNTWWGFKQPQPTMGGNNTQLLKHRDDPRHCLPEKKAGEHVTIPSHSQQREKKGSVGNKRCELFGGNSPFLFSPKNIPHPHIFLQPINCGHQCGRRRRLPGGAVGEAVVALGELGGEDLRKLRGGVVLELEREALVEPRPEPLGGRPGGGGEGYKDGKNDRGEG